VACYTETNHPGFTVGHPDRGAHDTISNGTAVHDGTAAYDTGTDNTGTDADVGDTRGYHHGSSTGHQLIAGRGTQLTAGCQGERSEERREREGQEDKDQETHVPDMQGVPGEPEP